MSEPFLAEIRVFGFNFAPRGWAFCDGQLLPIAQNQSLYSLLGTTYGGDGRTTFALPDLRGRAAMHHGTKQLGLSAGVESVALTMSQLPSHDHSINASTDTGNSSNPSGRVISASSDDTNLFESGLGPQVATNPAALTSNGSGQAHDNMQPSLVMNYCISISGLFPSRN